MIIQFSTEEMLSSLGLEVISAADAETALRELEGGRFDVLFTDVSLPGMSGVELAREARRCQPTLHVVFASGYGDVMASAGLEGDAQVILLPKPYSLNAIEQVFRTIAGLPPEA